MKGQRAWGRVYQGWAPLILTPLSTVAAVGPMDYVLSYPETVMNGAAGLFCLALCWPVATRLGLPYGVLILATVLPPLLTGGAPSLGRIASVLFTVFIWLGATVSPARRPQWLAAFACGAALVATIFFTWRPLF